MAWLPPADAFPLLGDNPANPHPFLAVQRQTSPVCVTQPNHSADGGPVVAVYSHEFVRQVLEEDAFSSAPVRLRNDTHVDAAAAFIAKDGLEHHQDRSLAAAAVAQWIATHDIGELVADVFGEFAPRLARGRTTDLVPNLASAFPLSV